MTENHTLEVELKNTQLALQMLAQISEFKAGFLARISHELRSPVSSLLSLHQLILSDLCENPEEEREFIQQAYQAASRLIKLLDQIVMISKLEAGKQVLQIEDLEVNQCLQECYQFTYLQAANRGLKLVITEDLQNLYLRTDRKRLQQALVMLIDTLISHLETGTIRLAAAADEQTIAINLDFPGSVNIWNEPIALLQNSPEPNPEAVNFFSKTLEFSPGMKLLLAQNLIETMQGNLTLTEGILDGQKFKRLQCLLPAGSVPLT